MYIEACRPLAASTDSDTGSGILAAVSHAVKNKQAAVMRHGV